MVEPFASQYEYETFKIDDNFFVSGLPVLETGAGKLRKLRFDYSLDEYEQCPDIRFVVKLKTKCLD